MPSPVGEKTLAQIDSDYGMSPDLWPGVSGDGVLDRAQAAENAAPARRRQRAASAQGAIREEHAGRRDDPRAPFMEGRLRCGAALPALAELGKPLLRSPFPQERACAASRRMI